MPEFAPKTSKRAQELAIIGWREWISLPALGIPSIKAKIDTGARTSALHAYFVEPYERNDVLHVRFGIHPHQGDRETSIVCDAIVVEERKVTDSGGHIENRFVIETIMTIGNIKRKIEVTLTNRDTMKFRMLIGRTALKNSFCVNPAASYLFGEAHTP
jgi:hypothetical protein